MAALVTFASLRAYTTDVCVAPSTTRCMLLGESAASSSCSSSHSGCCVPALITASGLSPRVLRPRAWAVVAGGGTELLSGGTHLLCRGVECIDPRALLRQFGRRRTEIEQADYPDPCQQGSDGV